jgi:hypothetical protein
MFPGKPVRFSPLRAYDCEAEGPMPTRYVNPESEVGTTAKIGVPDGVAVTEILSIAMPELFPVSVPLHVAHLIWTSL